MAEVQGEGKKITLGGKILQLCNFFATFAASTKSWIYEKEFYDDVDAAGLFDGIGTNEDGQGDGLERVECGQGG